MGRQQAAQQRAFVGGRAAHVADRGDLFLGDNGQLAQQRRRNGLSGQEGRRGAQVEGYRGHAAGRNMGGDDALARHFQADGRVDRGDVLAAAPGDLFEMKCQAVAADGDADPGQ